MLPRTRNSTRFPYTTLFRSRADVREMLRSDPAAFIAHANEHTLTLDACRDANGLMIVLQRLACVDHQIRNHLFEPPCVSDDERSEEHTSELQSQSNLVCRLL